MDEDRKIDLDSIANRLRLQFGAVPTLPTDMQRLIERLREAERTCRLDGGTADDSSGLRS